MCSLTPFGQTGPWRDYQTSDLLQLAAGGQMGCCGYDPEDVPTHPRSLPAAAMPGTSAVILPISRLWRPSVIAM